MPFFLLFAAGFLLSSAEAKYSGGTGDANNPYLIFSSEDMNAIGTHVEDWDKHFKMIANVDMSDYTGTEFNIIGTSSESFLGVFDGNGHTISNFTYKSEGDGPVGLFGIVGQEQRFPMPGQDPPIDLQPIIKNVGLISPTVSGRYGASLIVSLERGSCLNSYATDVNVTCTNEAGGLICYITEPNSVMGCFVSGKVSGSDFVGGFTGSLSGGIYNCAAVCDVVGNNHVGGFLGHSAGTGVYNCYSDSNVTGNEDVGGLTGSSGWGRIENCYSVGTVYGNSRVGGLSGDLYECDIIKSYAACEITNIGGGLVGRRTDSSVSVSFWDVEASDKLSSAGGTDKTTAEMQTESTFTDAGWDFTTPIWKICEGTNYPKLAWQVPLPGDFVCPDGVEMRDFAIMAGQWQLEQLSWDVAPDEGDGVVNFLDWAVFADQWKITKDVYDLANLVEEWLKTGSNSLIADITPVPDSDGIVDWRDLKLLGENWLGGL